MITLFTYLWIFFISRNISHINYYIRIINVNFWNIYRIQQKSLSFKHQFQHVRLVHSYSDHNSATVVEIVLFQYVWLLCWTKQPRLWSLHLEVTGYLLVGLSVRLCSPNPAKTNLNAFSVIAFWKVTSDIQPEFYSNELPTNKIVEIWDRMKDVKQ